MPAISTGVELPPHVEKCVWLILLICCVICSNGLIYSGWFVCLVFDTSLCLLFNPTHTRTHTHTQCFTSIVGPNGSGKSNVIDAMLFVFGYRARKIRSKKISILIHNSEHHLNLQSCSVGVHFQKIIDLVRSAFQNEYSCVFVCHLCVLIQPLCVCRWGCLC